MNAIIVDDTQAAIDNLAAKLGRYEDVTLVATATNGEDGIAQVMKHKPELLFLDMELPDMTGIQFLERLKEDTDFWCYVVIYTAYSDYMLPAFRNRAFDFLLKPIDEAELDTIMTRFFADRKSGASRRRQDDAVKRNGGKLLFYTNAVDFRLVRTRDICVFHYDHGARVWTVIAAGCDRPLRLKRSVSKDVLLGIDDCFVQVGQKFIININYLVTIKERRCVLYPPFDQVNDLSISNIFHKKLLKMFQQF